MARTSFKIVNGLAALFFIVAAGLQWNDPDPVRWASVYGAAALACLVSGGRRASWLPAAVGVVSWIWAIVDSPILPQIRFAELFQTMKAENLRIEESREFLGLVIVSTWMTVLTVVACRTARGGPPRPPGVTRPPSNERPL